MINETILTLGNSSQLNVVVMSQTDWSQYLIGLLIGGIFTIYLLYNMLKNQMGSLSDKIKLIYYKIKCKRTPILIKHNIDGLFSSNYVNRSDYEELLKILNKLKNKPIDIIIQSPGGDLFAAMRISQLLKNYPGHKRAVVSGYAMSAGTLITLSCDEIMMSDMACLGPVDPQIGNLFHQGSANGWKQLKKFKGKKINDDSFIMGMVGNLAELEIKYLILPLLNKHTCMNVVKYFVNGDLLHAHQFNKLDLRSMGFKILDLPVDNYDLLVKLITSKSLKSVNYG